MRTTCYRSIVVIAFLMCAGALWAQQTASAQQPPQASVSLAHSLLTEAAASNSTIQQEALTQIQLLLKGGSGGGSSNGVSRSVIVKALDRIALSSVSYVAESGTTPVNDFPWIRLKACSLLGDLGGANAEETLLEVVKQGSAPTVLAEAVYQLGRLHQDPNGHVAVGIAQRLQQTTAAHPDNNLAYECLVALQELAKAEHGIKEPSVYLAVADVSSGAYDRVVKDKAAKVLDSLATS